jgi:hypothetical protein
MKHMTSFRRYACHLPNWGPCQTEFGMKCHDKLGLRPAQLFWINNA